MSDNHDLLNDNDMCSFSGHEAEDMCFNCGDHTCGDGCCITHHNGSKINTIEELYHITKESRYYYEWL